MLVMFALPGSQEVLTLILALFMLGSLEVHFGFAHVSHVWLGSC